MGTVVQVGPKVTKSFKPGDRVAGFTHGVNAVEKEDGCFAQYAVAKGDVQCKLPDNLSDEDAATLGVGVTTVGQGLYQSLGLPLPGSGQKADYPLLVYGGSTATGSLAIQFAVQLPLRQGSRCRGGFRLQRPGVREENPRVHRRQAHQGLRLHF
jgi:NADPH:quinone reductase-like Zn-dependent oxidoreductase